MEPGLYPVCGFCLCDVVYYYDAYAAAVVAASHTFESLLTRSVPDLHFYSLVPHWQVFQSELNSYGLLLVWLVSASQIPIQDAGLPYPSVSNDNELELVIELLGKFSHLKNLVIVCRSFAAIPCNLNEVVPVHGAPYAVNVPFTLVRLPVNQVVEQHLAANALARGTQLDLRRLLTPFVEAHVALLERLFLLA